MYREKTAMCRLRGKASEEANPINPSTPRRLSEGSRLWFFVMEALQN
jgi:hypothetical protein